jgi:hypothetical protein
MIHSTLSSLPDITLDPIPPQSDDQTPEPSLPGSSVESSTASMLASDGDPDVNVPAFQTTDENVDDNDGSETTEQDVPSERAYVEALIQSALDLYKTYPLDHDSIRASEIMGHRSAIFTWEPGVADTEAIQIAHEGVDIVLPEPVEDREERERGEEQQEKTKEQRRRKRRREPQGGRRFTPFGQQAWSFGVIVAVIGFAGVVVAFYGTSTDTRRALAGWRRSWSWWLV